ncbi:hypothetical protein [Gordonibacter sp.]|uniref:hypothetical protein n=1 Tax=Gordonibacter sp. TaxID=1968902 RepID=UPI002FCBAEB5
MVVFLLSWAKQHLRTALQPTGSSQTSRCPPPPPRLPIRGKSMAVLLFYGKISAILERMFHLKHMTAAFRKDEKAADDKMQDELPKGSIHG